jgi:hypothetical protein
MASVSVTNQTLTMTIDIDGIETVIRKDNCKVQAFGTMVRITDYKGSIYEFLYSDCTAPSQPNANALRDAIEAFLNTGGGGGGGGITTITSIDGSIDIDLSNPNAPDLSLQNGSWNPTTTNVIGSPTVSVLAGNYSRVGSVVTCSLFLDVTMGVTENICEFRLDLPIASNFAATKDAFGIIAYKNATDGELVNWNIKANTATDDISIELESVTDEFNYTYLYVILQYVVI